MGVSIAAMIGSSMVARSIPYTPGVGAKQAAWLAHCAVVGAVIAPICLLGGPILTRAAWYTAGMVGGLSTVAVCAPSDKFLYMGGPLAMGLGVVFCASIASNFLPPTTALGAGMYSIAIYGGLVLVSTNESLRKVSLNLLIDICLDSLAPSCCTTPRKLSTKQRTILPTMGHRPSTQSTPPSASTWTLSTSSSGLQ